MIADNHIWTNTVTYFPIHQLQKSLTAKKHSSKWNISIPGATLGNFSGEPVNNISRNINHSQKQRDWSRDKDTVSPLCFLREMSGLTQEQPSARSVTDQVWQRNTEILFHYKVLCLQSDCSESAHDQARCKKAAKTSSRGKKKERRLNNSKLRS